MKINLENNKYLENLEEYSLYNINWNELNNNIIMISGATGLIGRYFIDLLMYKNINQNLNCKIVAIVRNIDKAKEIYQSYLNNKYFEIIQQDVTSKIEYKKKVNYIIHAASNTYPIQYATDPIGTISTNVLGTYNLFEFALKKQIKKFIFISSFEVYGQVDNVSKIKEDDFGKVDCTILRSCYPESKRLSESLCIAYSEQKKVNTCIIRLSRVFGPTMNMNSSLSVAQFIKNGVNQEDIVLKSDGSQLYSYNYVGDAVTAILTVMINGQNSQAYNIADEKFDATLRKFASIVTDYSHKNIIFDLPNDIEKKGFSNSTMTILDSKKLKNIGWYVDKNLEYRIKETIDIMKGE